MMPGERGEEEIFAEAVQLPTEQRADFLDKNCADDPALRQRVERLLGALDRASPLLREPPAFAGGLKPGISPAEKAGDRIGRYKLLEKIGEGGCGVVYVAEQQEPVRRRVALKVIKLGMDTKQVMARFDAERQALAMMDHPNIAKVLDAGATETGRPYFVMELVRGIKITDYCEQNQLSPRERLELFIQVCRAIQHAHQKGVIHRDIKPTNILVASDDGVPVPKVIDFGIAKATQGRLTDQTVYTAFEQFIGTPAYMSPEQAQLTLQDIDTRSDIYSLGVLLYELLTGTTPFDAKELLSKGLDEMRRTIREVEPVKPSTRLTQELATAGRDAFHHVQNVQARNTDAVERVPTKKSAIPSDLDWIVMKCLEKDRTRRYETANGLAIDIARHLNNEPIAARPPSQWYLLQKLARRNRGALITAMSVIVALLLGVVALAISNVRIRHEQAQKETALFTSLKSQALARRQSRQVGQQLDSLAAIREAATIRRDADLRDAAIAALAVPDLRVGPAWPAYEPADRGLAFDANYERYARINDQNVISIHTVKDNRELRRFPSGPAPQRFGPAFVFSPDGRLLAKFEVGSKWSVWQVDSGKLVLRTPPASTYGVAISADSAELAIPIEGSIAIFDLHAGEELRRWRVEHPPYTLAFSPDSRHLAAGSFESEAISIFDAEHGQLTSKLAVGKSANPAMAWHPSGKYLVVSRTEQIQFWDVKAAAVVSVLEGHAQDVTTLSFDPSGNWLISDSWDGTPRLWQPSLRREWIRFFSGSNILKFSKDSRWAGAMFPGDGKAQLLEFIPSQVYHTFVESLNDSHYSFGPVDISPDGRLLALASTGVSIREFPGGRELALLPVGPTTSARFHPQGKELLISGRQGFELWSIARDPVATNKLSFTRERRIPLPFIPYEFALAPDGRTMAISSKDAGEARLVDLETGTLHGVRFPHASTDTSALSPDGQLLATCGWQSLQTQLWNAQTGERLLNVTGERARVTFTPDGRELAVSTPQAYTFYDVRTRKVTRRFHRQSSMHPGWTAYSHDGKLMALEASPGVIQLCEVASGRTIAQLQDPNLNVNRYMVFSPDGTQLIVAAGYEKAIHRWDLRAMRAELKDLRLDWDWPEFSPESPEAKNASAFQAEVLSATSP
jgi:serine/threonine protein kinase/WD40 repeat protein